MYNAEAFRIAIRALAEAPEPADHEHGFTMAIWAHACGTPACVMGHIAARTDLQSVFALSLPVIEEGDEPDEPDEPVCQLIHTPSNEEVWPMSKHICDFFGVDRSEADSLFGCDGCGGAESIDDAISYIRYFCELKGIEL